jgi:hypothetical protein
MLLLAALLSLWVQGAVAPSDGQEVLVTVLAGATLVLAFHAGRMRRSLLVAATAFAAAAVTLSVARALGADIGEGAARLTNAALLLLGPPAVALGVVRDMRSRQAVRLQALFGVLALYVLVGMLFGFVFGAMDQLGGDPVFDDGVAATVSNCLYFSFTTLTTVGYGDVTTRSDLGHTVAIFEALIGQVYLVTIVSLLVGNLGRGRPRPTVGS